MGNVKGSLTSLASTASTNKKTTTDSSDSTDTNPLALAVKQGIMSSLFKKKNTVTDGGVEGSPYVGEDPTKKQAGRRRGTNTQGSGRGLNVA